MVISGAVRLVAIGLVVGLAGSLVVERMISNQLFHVPPLDPSIFGAIPLLLLFVTIAASCVPAARAASMDPIDALRA
jgi:macrolide transport system ATP-binding/permease protein